MLDILTTAVRFAALLIALAVNPCLLARGVVRREASFPLLLAVAGVCSFFINSAVPIGLHLLRAPITAGNLALAHALLLPALFALARLRRQECAGAIDSGDPGMPRGGEGTAPTMPLLATLLVLLVLPVTHLAGIDTYKWQDLASSVQTERGIPWLIHPLSLFGFTPRSYPSLQPLTLASAQVLGGLGVDGGFFAVSLLSALTGLFGAWLLGKRLFGHARGAGWFAALYVLSPVFMRYNHWATGRGFFVALLPLFLLAVIELPAARAFLSALLLAVLLPMSHKTGMVAIPLLLAGFLASSVLPRRDHGWLRVAFLIPFVLAAVALSPQFLLHGPAGLAAGFARRAVTRFGWYLLPAAVGLLAARGWFAEPAWRRLFPPMLLIFPLAFLPDMYGAMVALPFLCWAATAGLLWCFSLKQVATPRCLRVLAGAAAVLTLAGAVAVVVNRDLHATERAVWRAATFLEQYDPAGPFRIEAEETVRKQVQAYTSGCPRFDVHAPAEAHIALRRPPALRGKPTRVCREWIDYLRNALTIGDAGVDWYGKQPRRYDLIVRGDSTPLPGAERIYDRDGVQIYQPARQTPPR